MGYIVKLQKVDRPTNRSFYVTIPAVLVDSMGMDKGDELEWIVEDRNTLVLKRTTLSPSALKGHKAKSK
jgi:bifunctional DNA-binding transcriptional regulator/antitoxin component of YhaV-PrlF toxin-antitoxin module